MQILNWFLENIIWEILFIVFVVFIPGIFRIVKTTRNILKLNRETLGNGYGLHLADRFMEIWYCKRAILYKENRCMCIANCNQLLNTNRPEKDDDLVRMSLIDINNQKVVKPIKSWQNKCIAILIKFYLINFIGDSPKYYEDLRKRN